MLRYIIRQSTNTRTELNQNNQTICLLIKGFISIRYLRKITINYLCKTDSITYSLLRKNCVIALNNHIFLGGVDKPNQIIHLMFEIQADSQTELKIPETNKPHFLIQYYHFPF